MSWSIYLCMFSVCSIKWDYTLLHKAPSKAPLAIIIILDIAHITMYVRRSMACIYLGTRCVVDQSSKQDKTQGEGKILQKREVIIWTIMVISRFFLGGAVILNCYCLFKKLPLSLHPQWLAVGKKISSL